MFSHLFSWWRQREAKPELDVLMYTRQGCHLCADAWAQLVAAQKRHAFKLEAIDIDTDPQLRAAYGDCVPVVLVNGKVRFRGGVNPVLLKRLLASRRSPS